MQVTSYLPSPVELPQAVQHNANGDRAVLRVQSDNNITIQLEAYQNDNGDMEIALRGWGNKPGRVGNWNTLTLVTKLNPQPANTCEICYNLLEECQCTSSIQ